MQRSSAGTNLLSSHIRLLTPQVQGDYYGDLAARLGYFPSSIVREDQTLKPGKIDVKTDVSVLGAYRALEGRPLGCDDGQRCSYPSLPSSLAVFEYIEISSLPQFVSSVKWGTVSVPQSS